MQNKIPLDPNGVQPGYEVCHNYYDGAISKETPIAEIWRKRGEQEINITYWEEPCCILEDDGYIIIASLKPKQNA